MTTRRHVSWVIILFENSNVTCNQIESHINWFKKKNHDILDKLIILELVENENKNFEMIYL